jgi:tetratricopeptide (TPR) repeat protein
MRSRALPLFVLSAVLSCKTAGDAASSASDAGPSSDHPGGRPRAPSDHPGGRPRAPSDHPGGRSTASPEDALGPPTQHQLPTTDGAISLGNLTGQIDYFEPATRTAPGLDGGARPSGFPSAALQIVPLLATRSQYVGRVADAERALAVAEDLVRAAPDQASSYVARARARTGMHLFTAALADLAEAEKRGARPAALVGPRATILEGQGDLDGALALRRAERAARPDLVNTTLEASLLGQMGKTREAADLFAQAPAHYNDVSVFPVAWLFLQEGLFWERAGETARARAFYAAAHERLPAYGHAASHLALLEPPARGIELLLPIVAASDDPEFELILAGRLRAAGQAAEADTRLAHVRARYAELVDKHPEAYAEHAGWFLLDEGKDPERAYALAQQNLTVRKTEKAYQLALLAALAAGKRADACTLGAAAGKLPYASEMLRGIAEGACKPSSPEGASPKP